MKRGLAVLMVNMIASEFGYKVHWTRLASGAVSETFVLVNEDGDYHSFTGKNKFEQALEWLRQKA